MGWIRSQAAADNYYYFNNESFVSPSKMSTHLLHSCVCFNFLLHKQGSVALGDIARKRPVYGGGEHGRNVMVLNVFEILGREMAVFLIVCSSDAFDFWFFPVLYLSLHSWKSINVQVCLSFHWLSLSNIPLLLITDSQEIVVYCWSSLFFRLSSF